MAAKDSERWWALRVNGEIDGVWPTKKDLIANFDSYGLIDVKDLEKGPITIDIVPVDVTVAREATKKAGRP